MSNERNECTPETGHLPGQDHRWQECPTMHDDEPGDFVESTAADLYSGVPGFAGDADEYDHYEVTIEHDGEQWTASMFTVLDEDGFTGDAFAFGSGQSVAEALRSLAEDEEKS